MIDSTWSEDLRNIHKRADWIVQDAFLALSTGVSAEYFKGDLLVGGGRWRGANVSSIFRRNVRGKNICVGHSAVRTSLVKVSALKMLTGFSSAYVQNLDFPGGFARRIGCHPLPLGLTNPTSETPLHEIYGDQTVMMEAFETASPPEAGQARKLANFSVDTAPHHRQRLAAIIQTAPSVLVTELKPTRSARLTFLRDARSAGFVLCPEGRGMDTHRLYETLYMGATPVLLRGNYQWKLCQMFGWPAVGLRSWDELLSANSPIKNMPPTNFQRGGIDWLSRSFWEAWLFNR